MQLTLFPDIETQKKRDPTPEEIAAECKVIQSGWDADTEYDRQATVVPVTRGRLPRRPTKDSKHGA